MIDQEVCSGRKVRFQSLKYAFQNSVSVPKFFVCQFVYIAFFYNLECVRIVRCTGHRSSMLACDLDGHGGVGDKSSNANCMKAKH